VRRRAKRSEAPGEAKRSAGRRAKRSEAPGEREAKRNAWKAATKPPRVARIKPRWAKKSCADAKKNPKTNKN